MRRVGRRACALRAAGGVEDGFGEFGVARFDHEADDGERRVEFAVVVGGVGQLRQEVDPGLEGFAVGAVADESNWGMLERRLDPSRLHPGYPAKRCDSQKVAWSAGVRAGVANQTDRAFDHLACESGPELPHGEIPLAETESRVYTLWE